MVEMCACGHNRAEHYEYILNGQPQTRCKGCDPHTGRRTAQDSMASDSYEAAMYFAADHDFDPGSPVNPFDVGEIDRLASFIMEHFPDEPGKDGRNESAVDVAIRLLGDLQRLRLESESIVCAYCEMPGTRDVEAMKRHIEQECEHHPLRKALDENRLLRAQSAFIRMPERWA